MKIFQRYDAVVAGGGTAGSAATIIAGRLGLSVLVIEPQSYLGGTSTGGLVTPLMGNSLEPHPLNTGITQELLADLERIGKAKGLFFDPVAMKLLLEQKAVDAGVDILYESVVVGVDVCRGKVCGVEVATRQGLAKIECDVLVDATGDAQACDLAGVETRYGRETDHQHQPMSLRFVLGGLDIQRFRECLRDKGGPESIWDDQEVLVSRKCGFMKQYAIDDNWPDEWLNNFGIQFFEVPSRKGELWFNCPRLSGFDPLGPCDRSRAYVEGRKFIEAYVALFTKHIDGAQESYLVMEAPQIGIREGRRIVGRYVLSQDDFLSSRKFDDGICCNRYPIDIHRQNESGVELVEMEEGRWQEIPYRCLIPEKIKGLIVAGRCISSDFVSQASYRIISNCHTLGEAAGVACWLARDADCDVSEVDGKRVRRMMIEKGMLPRWLD